MCLSLLLVLPKHILAASVQLHVVVSPIDYEVSVKKYLKRDDWYMWAQMTKGTITQPLFTSLDGYWPSVKVS